MAWHTCTWVVMISAWSCNFNSVNGYKPLRCEDACRAKSIFGQKSGFQQVRTLLLSLKEDANTTEGTSLEGDFRFLRLGYKKTQNYSELMHQKEKDELEYYMSLVEFRDELACKVFNFKNAKLGCFNKVIEVLVLMITVALFCVWFYCLCV